LRMVMAAPLPVDGTPEVRSTNTDSSPKLE
jgi:hypothetical protein